MDLAIFQDEGEDGPAFNAGVGDCVVRDEELISVFMFESCR